MRAIGRLLLRLCAALAILVIVAMAGMSIALSLESGRRLVASAAGSIAERLTGYPVRIDGLGLSRPLGLAIASLHIGPMDGPLVQISDAAVTWSWADIRRLEFRPHSLEIAAVVVSAMPEPRKETSGAFRLPELAPPILPIQSFSVQRADIAPAVLGQPMSLKLSGRESYGPDGRWSLDADIRRRDRPTDGGKLTIGYGTTGGALRVDATLFEAAGGVIGARLGIPVGDIDLRIVGDGPAIQWRGALRGRASGLGRTEAALTLAIGETIDGSVRGTVTADALSALPDPIGYQATIVRRRSGDLDVSGFRLETPGASLTAAGTVARDGSSVDVAGEIKVDSVARFFHAVDGRAIATYRLHGDPTDLTAVVDFGGSGLSHNRMAVRTLRGRTDIRHIGTAAIQAKVDAELDGVDGLPPPVLSMTGTKVKLAAEVSGDLAHELGIQSIRLSTAHLTVEGGGRVRPSVARVDARARVTLDDLSPVATGVIGRATADLDVTANWVAGSVAATGQVALSEFSTAEDVLARVLGKSPNATFSVRRRPDGRIDVESLAGRFAAGTAGMQGHVDTAHDRLALDISADVPNLGGATSDRAKGRGRAELKLSGSLSAPRLGGQFRFDDLAVGDYRAQWATATIDILDLLRSPAGSVLVEAKTGEQVLTAAAEPMLIVGERLDIRRLVLDFAGGTVVGDLRYALPSGMLDGALKVDIRDVGPASRIAGIDLSGRIEGQATFAQTSAGQEVRIALAADGVGQGAFSLREARIDARMTDLFRRRGLTAEVQVAGGVGDGLRIQSATLGLNGELGAMQYSIDAVGEASRPVDLSAQGTAGIGSGNWWVAVDNAVGRFGVVPIKLEHAFRLSVAAAAQKLEPARLSIGTGQLSIEGGITGQSITAVASIVDFPLALLGKVTPEWEVAGLVNGGVELTGDVGNPLITMALRASEVRASPDLPPLLLKVSANASGGTVAVAGSLDGLGVEPLTFNGRGPMDFSIRPWSMRFPEAGPIAGDLKGSIGLPRAVALLLPLDDEIDGVATIDARIGGTLSAPSAEGRLGFSDVRYVNAASEAVVTDLSALMIAEGSVIRVSMKGQDGANGNLTLDGAIELDRSKHFPLRADLALQGFRVARRDDVSASVDAKMRFGPNLEAPTVTGTISIVEAELRIPDRLPPNVVELDVREINRSSQRTIEERSRRKSTAAVAIGLDMTVTAPGRVFVRGRGLDSEWGGTINLRGTSAEPRLAGALRMQRGTMDLLGKRLTGETGTITFAGGSKLDPDLLVVATFPAGATTGEARLAGTLSAPSISLASRSGLPQDEVLSQFLFGSGVATLTPLQALQLADSAAALVGGRTGAGPLDRIRQGIGLDRLDVQGATSADGSPSVEAGKYIAPNILLKAQQGTAATGPTVGVEVELTPNISVDSKVGPDAKSSIGVNLKKDY